MTQLKVSRPTPQRANRRSTVSPLLWELAQGDPAVALKTMEASLEGLTDAEVERRRRIYGKNEVAHQKPPPWWVQFLKAFSTPFILVLLILAFVSYITDVYLAREPQAVDWRKVIILAAMILVSGILRFWQEFRSIRAAERLKAMVRTTATVSRIRTNDLPAAMRGTFSGCNGSQEVPIAELVPGDIIHLSAGDMVPADVRLIAAKDFFVSQSVLTGESMPVEKHNALGLGDKDSPNTSFSRQASPLGMNDLSFTGTNVVSGTATAVVVATGARTFFGSLAGRVIGRRATDSFGQGVNKVTFVLIKFMLIMVPVVMVLTGITKGDLNGSCSRAPPDRCHHGDRSRHSLHTFRSEHRAAASPKGLLSLVGRDVAELLRPHAVSKALVYSAVQDMVIAGLEAEVRSSKIH
jgi:Mg2+-importing ATPase